MKLITHKSLSNFAGGFTAFRFLETNHRILDHGRCQDLPLVVEEDITYCSISVSLRHYLVLRTSEQGSRARIDAKNIFQDSAGSCTCRQAKRRDQFFRAL